MNIQDIAIIITTIGSALAGYLAYLKFFVERRVDERSFDATESAKWRAAYNELQTQINDLRVAFVPSPAPEWKKNGRRQYVYVSPSYEVIVLFRMNLTFADIKGKTDEEIFTKFPHFVKLLKEIDDEAQVDPAHVAIRRNVKFPTFPEPMVIIKEIARGGAGDLYYIGRCYPDKKFIV